VESIEIIRKFIKDWGAVVACFGAGIGVFYEHTNAVRDIKSALENLKQDCDSRNIELRNSRLFGVDGFTDPTIRAGIDATVRNILKSFNEELRAENRHWRDLFFQINPNLKRPAE
jgi:hypothetical protein